MADTVYSCMRCGYRWEPVCFDPVGELVRPGAVDVCRECAAVVVFGDDLEVRPAMADDIFENLTYKQVGQLAELVMRLKTRAELRRMTSTVTGSGKEPPPAAGV